MRKNSVKNIRVNAEVMRELSVIIREDIKDPRISPLTSVVAVEVTPDLKYARAYISVLGSPEEGKDTIKGLKSAEGYIRAPAGTAGKFKKHTGTYLCAGSVH